MPQRALRSVFLFLVLSTVLSGCIFSPSDSSSDTSESIVKSSVQLAFEQSGSVRAVLNEAVSNPLIETPDDGVVSYTSSNQAVARIDSEGAIELVGVGITTITALLKEDARYFSAQTSFELVSLCRW